jgi:hypothetical protein
MNVEIGAEAALFLEKEYVNGIAIAVYIKYSTGKWLNRDSWLNIYHFYLKDAFRQFPKKNLNGPIPSSYSSSEL